MPEAIDFSFSPPDYACAKRSGVELGIVYTSIGPSGKNITKAKADAMLAAGLDIAIVFEESAGHMLGGAPAGKAAALASIEMSRAAGQPLPGITHYFALDVDPNQLTPAQHRAAARWQVSRAPRGDEVFDAVVRYANGLVVPVMLTASQWDAVAAYGDAAKVELDRVGDDGGIYGGLLAIEKMVGTHYLRGWQTYAWSGGQVSTKASLYQYQNGQSFCGGLVDYDTIRKRPYGGWGDAEMALNYAETVQAVIDGLNKAATDNTHEFGITGDRVKVLGDKLDAVLVALQRGIAVDVPELAAALAVAFGPELGAQVADELQRRLAS